MEEESKLDEFKQDYSKLKKLYDLPEFSQLNEDFSIEKLCETESDFLLREIRRFMADKFSNYLRMIEMFLHPSNAPMFIFAVVKSLKTEDKEKLTETYKQLAKIEVNLIDLDLQFDEKKEIEFVKNNFKIWQDIKKDLLQIIDGINSRWDEKIETNGKGYFG